MESRNFLAFSLCLVLIFPCLSIQIPQCLAENKINGSVLKLQRGAFSDAFDPSRVTQLSWRPRAFIYKGFLSDDECDHLINLARGKLQKSMVADDESGKSVESEERTSYGMFLFKAQDEIVANIEARIAKWTFFPEENGESLQILHYEHGQKYEPHLIFFLIRLIQRGLANELQLYLCICLALRGVEKLCSPIQRRKILR